jgi:hypothetical protein
MEIASALWLTWAAAGLAGLAAVAALVRGLEAVLDLDPR